MKNLDFSALAGYTVKQQEAIRALRSHRYVLYGGARGGGKSRWLRWALLQLTLYRAIKQDLRQTRTFLFCEDYPTLEDRQISKISREFPRWLGELKTTKTDGLGFYLHEQYGGGVLCLRNLDDPSKYAGAEFTDCGVDELTRTTYQTFNDLRGSLRWPGVDDPHFLAATMPGGPGHLWVKQLWIDRDFPLELMGSEEQFAFIPALATDNPHNSPTYIDMLRSQPEARRRAWLEGDWNVFEGQVFTEWRTHIHVVRGRLRPPANWRWVAGMDWGYSSRGWVGLAAVGPDQRIYLHWDWAFRELHSFAAGQTLGGALKVLPRPEWIAADEQMWYKVGTQGPNLAEEFAAGLKDVLGPGAPPVIAAPHGRGSRATKLQTLHHALAWTPQRNDPTLPVPWGMPLLRSHERCEYFNRTIPALAYDKTRSEDVDTHGEDHAYDGVGNILLARLPGVDQPDQPVDENQHPGLTRSGKRRGNNPEADAVEDFMAEVANATTRSSPAAMYRAGRRGREALDD